MLNKDDVVELNDEELEDISGGVDDPNFHMFRKGYSYRIKNESGDFIATVQVINFYKYEYGHNCYFVRILEKSGKETSKIVIEEEIKNKVDILNGGIPFWQYKMEK